MPDSTSCCRAGGGYCQRCDLLLGLPGLHVVGVQRDDAGLRVEVESVRPEVMGCPACGVIAHAHGRQRVELIDAPCFTAPVKLWWRKRRWLCPEPMCPVNSFMEQDPDVATQGAAHQSRDVVGDRADAAGERLGPGDGPAARLRLEDAVASGQADP
ncbi:hypothetical protein GCM10022275_34490 [Tessaracoccus defluvii]